MLRYDTSCSVTICDVKLCYIVIEKQCNTMQNHEYEDRILNT